jgi:uncharacterized protein (AIM24 family)
LFKFNIEEELCCKVEGSGKFYAKKGAMVAFKGNFIFDKMLLGPNNGGSTMDALLGLVKRKLTGENVQLMTVEGSGVIYSFLPRKIAVLNSLIYSCFSGISVEFA